MKNQQTSRRSFFAGTAGVLSAAAVAAYIRPANAQSTTPSDLDILNFALRLENLEATFYAQGLQKFHASDFAASQTFSLIGAGAGANIYSNLQAIAQHEASHVAALTSTIKGLGGTPIPIDCYNFPYQNPDDFLAIAQTLENTGVMAYDGAVALISSPALLQTAATIATVEARHASYLNLLNATIPFPAAFDTTQTMAQILATAGGFIASNCPAPVPMTLAVAGPKNVSTANKTITLDATQSTSANGQPLRYLWTVEQASQGGQISNPYVAQPTLTFNNGPGTYSIQLWVRDSSGFTTSDTVIITYTGS